jgi:hypothetical protein
MLREVNARGCNAARITCGNDADFGASFSRHIKFLNPTPDVSRLLAATWDLGSQGKNLVWFSSMRSAGHFVSAFLRCVR